MKKVLVIFCILFLSLLFAFAQETQEEETEAEQEEAKKDTSETAETVSEEVSQEDKEIDEEKEEVDETFYSAKKIEYIIDEELIILSDSAMSKHKDIIVTADTIEYNVKTKVVKAYGHPFLIDKEDTITGKLMIYNIETKRGMVTLGGTEIEKGFFTGDTILKVGEKILNVKNGSFTTCPLKPPHYDFYSRRMKIYGNDIVVCEPVILKIQTIPVFFVPFWFFPIKKGRHSGFLFPKIGKGSSEGRYVRNLSYFWATNDYADITFTVDLYEKKGIKTNLAGRYIVTPFLTGSVTGSYINDTFIKSKRWNFILNHQQNLARRTNLSAHADFISDVNYNVDYSEEEIVQLNKEIESYVSLSKSWSGANLSFLVNEKRDLAKSTTDRRLPRIGFSLSSRKIIPVKDKENPRWYNSAYMSYSSRFINKVHKDEDSTVTRYGLANSMRFQSPQKVFRYFNISPSVTVWENVYDRDRYGSSFPVRSHYSTSIGLSTVLYGISQGGIGRLEKFRHIIKPSMSYNYSPEEDNVDRYLALEGMGVGYPVKNMSFSLSNLVQTKYKIGEKEIKIDLISLKTSASYNFKRTEYPLSNITNTVEVEPVRIFSTRLQFEHNPYTRELKKFTIRSNIKLQGMLGQDAENEYGNEGTSKKIWRMNVTHNFVKGIGENIDSQQLFGGMDTWITKNWRVGFNTRYDFNEKKFINQSLSIYRDLHCWEAQFSWNSYGGRWKYDFKIKIKKIPEIKVTKGVFGIFIP